MNGGSDIALAMRLLVFAFDHLDYPSCPDHLPMIEVDPDILADNEHGRITYGTWATVITLREWDTSAYWQGVLVHELVHYLQHFNNVPSSEPEAERVRHAWLQNSEMT